MSPFRTVDDLDFKLLIKTLDPSARVLARPTLISRIQERVEETKKGIKSLFKKTPYAASCADIWATKHDSFLGVVATFIDNDFNRHLRLLSCQPFGNPHTGKNIAEALSDVHLEFGLPLSKLLATTTDNASNNNKAFKDFGIRLISDIEADDDDDVHNESGDEIQGADIIDGGDIGELQSALLPIHLR